MIPRSSFTNTSGAAHSAAATGRSRRNAAREKASSGTANAISWNCAATAACIPQDRAYPSPNTVPQRDPYRSTASRVSGHAETPRRTACTRRSASPEGQSAHTGPRSTRIGWKWSPSRLKSMPLIGTTGASNRE